MMFALYNAGYYQTCNIIFLITWSENYNTAIQNIPKIQQLDEDFSVIGVKE